MIRIRTKVLLIRNLKLTAHNTVGENFLLLDFEKSNDFDKDSEAGWCTVGGDLIDLIDLILKRSRFEKC